LSSEYTGFEIAIVGMAGRFPSSKNVNELWSNLCAGKNLISYFEDDELIKNGIPETYLEDSNYIKARGIIEDVDKFDAAVFGFYPKEIEMLDPQQRIFLECCWEAMEDSGYCPDDYKGLAGIFGGIGMNTYVLQFLKSNKDLIVSAEGYQLSIGNDKDFLTTRVSYKLNMTGPSVNIQTACSTSLVATHIACMNLINYQCDVALAGGSTVSLPQISGYHYQEGMILSPDGVCRPFDKDAAGTVSSNGCGVVVLKRLQDAIDDKDDIYAVIKGSAYNNDGAIKVGYTAPGVKGQSDVLTAAYGMAEIPLSSIGYVETHGTGTSLGDPIEIDALTKTFRQETSENQFCAIGSVKSNLGHLDTAAGITGLIKAALSIYYGKIPPSINFTEPNPKLFIENSPFYVNTELKDWDDQNTPRRAGVSSFGIGGTNAHVVLEQAPAVELEKTKEECMLFPFSAKSKLSLNNAIISIHDYLHSTPGNFNSISYTLQEGRKEFEQRTFTVAKNLHDLKQNLSSSKKNLFSNHGKILETPYITFMFSGQGAQYINMCVELYNTEKKFKDYVDECLLILEDNLDINLKELIFPTSTDLKEASEKLKQTEYTQPALFVIEYSLAMFLIDIGIKPSQMVGHSIGEFVAACISGVMDLKSGLTVVAKRGALMQKLQKGSMLSVTLSENELKQILPESLDISVINSSNLCVVSGEDSDIINFEKILNQKEISSAFLHTSHAFHSRMMDPVLDEFKSIFSSIELKQPSVPYMSNVTGEFITNSDAVDPNYYVNHLRYTIRFSDNISNLLKNENTVLVEVGPGSTLASLAKLSDNNNGHTIVNSVKHPSQEKSDREVLLDTIGKLWLTGVNINWRELHRCKPSRIHLPTYSFNKKRYWLKSPSSIDNKVKTYQNALSVDSWLYEQLWKRSNLSKDSNYNFSNSIITVFENERIPISSNLKNAEGIKVITVSIGTEYKKYDNLHYELNPNSLSDYSMLIDEWIKLDLIPDNIIHAWGTINNFEENGENEFQNFQSFGFISLIYLAKSFIRKGIQNKVALNIICSNIFDVLGNEELIPEKSTILGAVKVIQQELLNFNIHLIEIDTHQVDINSTIKQVLNEINNDSMEFATAFRSNYKWTQNFENINNSPDSAENLLKEKGTYLITGGLGRIGLIFAEYLIERYSANLVLVDQIDFPHQNEWENIIAKDDNDHITAKVHKLIKLVSNKSQISILKANIANEVEIRNCVKTTTSKFGTINGIIHAAGTLGDNMVKMIADFNSIDFSKQIEAKISGTLAINNAIKGIPIDFVLIQSSLSSILGGVGFASYSAVNNFIDTYVAQTAKEFNSTRWLSINWDGWKFDDSATKGISPRNGIKILEKIMRKTSPSNFIVSIGDLGDAMEKWIHSTRNSNEPLEEESLDSQNCYERPELEVEYLEPVTDLEKQICNEWKKLLGIKEIGINDNFFDLGGDSLIGTQLVSRIRKEFSADIPLVAIFENATIGGISKLIENNQVKDSDSEKVSSVMDMINEMSDEDVAKMLEQKSSTEK